QRFPMMGPVEYRWSGQVMETVDCLGFIGHNPLAKPSISVAAGDSGMGMTHGTLAGMLLRDLIMGRENPWQKLYDPRRKALKTLWEFHQGKSERRSRIHRLGNAWRSRQRGGSCPRNRRHHSRRHEETG